MYKLDCLFSVRAPTCSVVENCFIALFFSFHFSSFFSFLLCPFYRSLSMYYQENKQKVVKFYYQMFCNQQLVLKVSLLLKENRVQIERTIFYSYFKHSNLLGSDDTLLLYQSHTSTQYEFPLCRLLTTTVCVRNKSAPLHLTFKGLIAVSQLSQSKWHI